MSTVLYDYWRSSASYRVRIALGLAAVPFNTVPVNLLTKENVGPEHLARNPQGLVPALHIDGHVLTQSLAIVEYLNATRPVRLLPEDVLGQARVRALSYAIAMEIHPVCNLRVMDHLATLVSEPDAARSAWMKKYIGEGLDAFETMLETRQKSAFCHGQAPTMADICLIPQLYNATRWEVDWSQHRRIAAIAANCQTIPAFVAAHPDRYKP